MAGAFVLPSRKLYMPLSLSITTFGSTRSSRNSSIAFGGTPASGLSMLNGRRVKRTSPMLALFGWITTILLFGSIYRGRDELFHQPCSECLGSCGTIASRIDKLWYKYIHMVEMLGNIARARQSFEQWMAWEPDHHSWAAYIKFELRYNEVGRARGIYERYVRCRPMVNPGLDIQSLR